MGLLAPGPLIVARPRTLYLTTAPPLGAWMLAEGFLWPVPGLPWRAPGLYHPYGPPRLPMAALFLHGYRW
ncbi:MAG TPA: hypothetical protein VIN09_00285 [Chloroflexota bacterium]